MSADKSEKYAEERTKYELKYAETFAETVSKKNILEWVKEHIFCSVRKAWEEGYKQGELDCIGSMQYQLDKITELEQQLDNLKNCSNCKNFVKDYELCRFSLGDSDYDCRLRKWEWVGE